MPKQPTPEMKTKLQEWAKPLLPQLKEHSDKFKSMLHPKLQPEYNICYWSDDGCYYCSDDGINWVAVECIT